MSLLHLSSVTMRPRISSSLPLLEGASDSHDISVTEGATLLFDDDASLLALHDIREKVRRIVRWALLRRHIASLALASSSSWRIAMQPGE
mmetsp:Transcript_12598/g.38003  ORF Transcript_12598/g.38003 Transcript_12598/m.38003 type:complete len:90 (+) Transcript_12598:563-832(+)